MRAVLAHTLGWCACTVAIVETARGWTAIGMGAFLALIVGSLLLYRRAS